jgi:hypothetical protein
VGAKTTLGPHGIRVRAYNDSLAGNGEELTVVHGGWKSTAHSRYARFTQIQVLSISAGMLGVRSQFKAGERTVSRARTRRGSLAAVAPPATFGESDADDEDDDDDAGSSVSVEAAPLVPAGYTTVERLTKAGRRYNVYVPPGGGAPLQSRPAAWRHWAS